MFKKHLLDDEEALSQDIIADILDMFKDGVVQALTGTKTPRRKSARTVESIWREYLRKDLIPALQEPVSFLPALTVKKVPAAASDRYQDACRSLMQDITHVVRLQTDRIRRDNEQLLRFARRSCLVLLLLFLFYSLLLTGALQCLGRVSAHDPVSGAQSTSCCGRLGTRCSVPQL